MTNKSKRILGCAMVAPVAVATAVGLYKECRENPDLAQGLGLFGLAILLIIGLAILSDSFND